MSGKFMVCLVCAVFMLCGFPLGFMVGKTIESNNCKELQIKAVENGCAEWVVDDKGKTEFKWKEKNND